ncbi:MAG TPA: metal-dependent hydrolase [Polyangium sp.]|nr:metal-dependent hydrolase [Polyangium sp.]
MNEASVTLGPVPRPRSPGVDLDSGLPRYWFGGNAAATHIANGVNLLFPAGERFFVRSVNHYLDQIDDPHLRKQVKGFFGQEGRHAKEHERQFRLLEAQGYDVERILALYERIAYGFIEKVAPQSLALATTAAAEHFTAILAENALSKGLLGKAHPVMQQLLFWHASEEIEHRSVAFDVLRKVNPSYGLRIAGLAMASLCLTGFWALAVAMLVAQDDECTSERLLRDFIAMRKYRNQGEFLVKGIRSYMRPDFHPSQSDVDHLAAQYLASVGLA